MATESTGRLLAVTKRLTLWPLPGDLVTLATGFGVQAIFTRLRWRNAVLHLLLSNSPLLQLDRRAENLVRTAYWGTKA